MTVEAQQSLRDWHRLFGLLLMDFFSGSPFQVEVERDLSVQQQLLDVTIVRRGEGRFAGRLPDGLGDLRPHNLLSFKSRHEPLDAWTLKELIGADVAYRKLVSPSPTNLLPDDQFALYVVAARFPHNLSGQVPWQRVQTGVYDCHWGTDTIRVVVAGELPQEPQNAPLHLFSASPELVDFGSVSYQRRSEQTSRLLGQLFEKLRREGFTMSFTMEDFNRQYSWELFQRLTPEEQRKIIQAMPLEQRLAGVPPEQRLAGVPPEQRLAGVPPEQRLAGLSLEQRLAGLPPELLLAGVPPEQRLAGLPPEQRLAGLSAEQIREYLDQLTAGQPTKPPKSRRKK